MRNRWKFAMENCQLNIVISSLFIGFLKYLPLKYCTILHNIRRHGEFLSIC